MAEIRCKKCNRLLMMVETLSEAEIKCPKCKYINSIYSVPEIYMKIGKGGKPVVKYITAN